MAQEIGDVVGLAKPVTEKRLEFYRKWNRLFLNGETALIRVIGIYFKIHDKYKCHQNALTAAQKV